MPPLMKHINQCLHIHLLPRKATVVKPWLVSKLNSNQNNKMKTKIDNMVTKEVDAYGIYKAIGEYEVRRRNYSLYRN